MHTNIDLDDTLISKAMSLSKLKSKKETVNLALQEFVQRHEQSKIIKLFGTIDLDNTYDHKEQRHHS